jgi:CubicO group peptidase (beta-lactamase class C family)
LIKNKTLRNYPLFTKGSFRYSSIGYVLIGGIISKVSKKAFCDFVSENIFVPLGMNRTGCIIDTNPQVITTFGYSKNEGDSFTKVSFSYRSFAQGNGNLYSNLNDLIIWDKAIKNRMLLSKASYTKWYTGYAEVLEQSEYDDKGDMLGYGWFLTFNNNVLKKAYHIGGVTGFKASITRYPQEELLIVTLSNVEDQYSNKIRLDFPKLVYRVEIEKKP